MKKPVDINVLLNIIIGSQFSLRRVSMSESYEKLTGAKGRQRFYRPMRYGAEQIFSGAAPKVWFDDDEFSLENISASGAAGKTRDFSSASLLAGGRGLIRLTQHGQEIFRAPGRAARCDVDRGATIVGFALERGVFDLDRLVQLNARALAETPVSNLRSPGVSADYKTFCADFVGFIGEYMLRIERHFGKIENQLSAEEMSAIANEMGESARKPLWEFLVDGNRLAIPVQDDKAARSAMKAYTERVVTRAVVGGESWARSYYKPLGYPGDFEIMNYVYDGSPIGTDLKSKFLHKLGVIAGDPIITRMNALASLIAAHAHEHESADPINILSVGCGPARELETILNEAPAQARFNATLVDQEERALEYAVRGAKRLAQADRVKTTALNISFKDMLSPSSLAAHLVDQDIVYSSGLVDYLNPLLAMRFVRRMFDYIKPGGKLIIGNVNSLETGLLWDCEHVLDWTMYFRNETEMQAMTGETSGARISIERDPLNAVFLLVLEKPAS